MKALLVLVGGGLGSLSRYGINLLAMRLAGDKFPLGTLVVNLAGCFLIGMAFSLGSERNALSPAARLFVMTGFLGGLTTFSSFALETVNYSQGGLANTAMVNFVANNVCGLLLVVIGMWAGRSI